MDEISHIERMEAVWNSELSSKQQSRGMVKIYAASMLQLLRFYRSTGMVACLLS
jgi:hypothetical protein